MAKNYLTVRLTSQTEILILRSVIVIQYNCMENVLLNG